MIIKIEKATTGYLVGRQVEEHCRYESYACETIDTALNTVRKIYQEEEDYITKTQARKEKEVEIRKQIEELNRQLKDL